MALLQFFASIRNPFLTAVSEVGRYFGEEVVFLALVCILLWCVDKKFAYRIGFAFFTSAFLSQELKIIFRVPRPWVLDPTMEPLESAVPTATGYSFPSAHSQTSASLYGTIGSNTKKKGLRIFCIVAMIMTPLARMYAGVHTPLDVSVGFCLGILCVILCNRFIGPLIEAENPAKVPCLILGLFSVIGLVSALVFVAQGSITEANAKDVLSSMGSALAFSLGYYLDMTRFHIEIKGTKLQMIIKIVIGIATTLGLRVGLKTLLAPIGPAGHYIRYFVISIWALLLFPVLFNKVLEKSEK